MTVVADILATLRVDGSDMESGFNRGKAAAQGFGAELGTEVEKLGRVKEAAGIAATIIGGTFVEAMHKGLEIGKEYNAELERMQVTFGSLMGSNGAGSTQIKVIEEFANKMGLSTSSVAGMSQSLQVLTQGQHDTTKEWTAFSNEAAALGRNVDEVANSFGRVYQLMQRSGSSGAGYATRSLINTGEIGADTANQIAAMAKSGADIDAIWNKLIDGAAKFKGAGAEAAGTMQGLKQTFHNFVSEDVGTIFQPIIKGMEELITAINAVMNTQGFKDFIESIGTKVEEGAQAFTRLADGVTKMGSGINGSQVGRFVGDLKGMESTLGVLTGLVAEFGAEFIGHLPIINRFAGPFIKFLDDGRGGLIGLMISTKESREALIHFGESVFNLAKAFLEMTGPVDNILKGMAQVVGIFANGAAAVINWIASNKEAMAAVKALVEALIVLKIIDTITNSVGSLINAVGRVDNQFDSWRSGILNLHLAKSVDIADNEKLAASITGVSEAQAAANAESKSGGFGAMGIMGGLAIGGAAAAAGAAGTHGALHRGLSTVSGALSGAAVGSMIGPEGTAIGALVGGAMGWFSSKDKGNKTSPEDLGKADANAVLGKIGGGDDYHSINARVTATRNALADATDQRNAFGSKPGGGAEKGNQAKLKEMISEVDQLGKAYKDAQEQAAIINKNVADIEKNHPGATIAEISAKATELGVNLSQGGRNGADAVNQITAALNGSSTAIDKATAGARSYLDAQTHLHEIASAALSLQKEKIGFTITDIQNQEDAVKFAYQLTQAQFSADQAARSLSKANEGLAIAQGQGVDAYSQFNAAIAHNVLLMPNLNQMLAQMTQNVGELPNPLSGVASSFKAIVDNLQPLQDMMTQINRTIEQQQLDLTVLTDKQKEYQDIINKPLAGSKSQDAAIHQNQLAQDTIRKQIADLEAAGRFSQDPAIMQMQTQLNILSKQGESLSLNKNLTLGDQQFQLQQLAKGSQESSFSDAQAAATQVGNLQDKINNATQAMDANKTKADTLNDSFQIQNEDLQKLAGAYQAIIGSNTGILAAWEGQVQAIHGVRDAEEELRSLAVQAEVKNLEVTTKMIDQQLAQHQIAMETIKQVSVSIDDSVTGATKKAADSIGTLTAKTAAMLKDITNMNALQDLLGATSDPSKQAAIRGVMAAINNNQAGLANGSINSPFSINGRGTSNGVIINVDINGNTIQTADDLHAIVSQAVTDGVSQVVGAVKLSLGSR